MELHARSTASSNGARAETMVTEFEWCIDDDDVELKDLAGEPKHVE